MSVRLHDTQHNIINKFDTQDKRHLHFSGIYAECRIFIFMLSGGMPNIIIWMPLFWMSIRKCLTLTNALDYYAKTWIRTVKRFMGQLLEGKTAFSITSVSITIKMSTQHKWHLIKWQYAEWHYAEWHSCWMEHFYFYVFSITLMPLCWGPLSLMFWGPPKTHRLEPQIWLKQVCKTTSII